MSNDLPAREAGAPLAHGYECAAYDMDRHCAHCCRWFNEHLDDGKCLFEPTYYEPWASRRYPGVYARLPCGCWSECGSRDDKTEFEGWDD